MMLINVVRRLAFVRNASQLPVNNEDGQLKSLQLQTCFSVEVSAQALDLSLGSFFLPRSMSPKRIPAPELPILSPRFLMILSRGGCLSPATRERHARYMTYEAHIARLSIDSSATAGSAAATAGGSDRDSSEPGTAATPREIILNSH